MALLDPKLMPTDQTGEIERAARALKKIRNLLSGDTYNLPYDWQAWVAKQVAGGYVETTEKPEDHQ